VIPSPTHADFKLLSVKTIRKNTVWYRISDPTFPSPLYFNKDQSGRWNSPGGEYGVCYVADSIDTAFAETFGHGVMGATLAGKPKIITEKRLTARHLYTVHVQKTLYLGELFGKGLVRLSLDNTINTTTKYNLVQPWSAWVFNHPQQLLGIRYQSKHLSDTLCCALFDRPQIAKSFLTTQDHGPLSVWRCKKTARTIDDILDEQGYVIF